MGERGQRGVRTVISTSSSPHDSRTEMADSMPSSSPNGAAAVVVAGAAAAGAVVVAVAVVVAGAGAGAFWAGCMVAFEFGWGGNLERWAVH